MARSLAKMEGPEVFLIKDLETKIIENACVFVHAIWGLIYIYAGIYI